MEGGTKVSIIGPGHMTKMANMPLYVKPFKNLLLQNRKSYDLETWPEHLGLKLYNVYINDDPGLTFTYLTSRSNLFPNAFKFEKMKI